MLRASHKAAGDEFDSSPTTFSPRPKSTWKSVSIRIAAAPPRSCRGSVSAQTSAGLGNWNYCACRDISTTFYFARIRLARIIIEVCNTRIVAVPCAFRNNIYARSQVVARKTRAFNFSPDVILCRRINAGSVGGEGEGE